MQSFRSLAESKNMSEEDLQLILTDYGYFSEDGIPLQKWISAGVFNEKKQFNEESEEGENLLSLIISKKHKYQDRDIVRLLKHKGVPEDKISYTKSFFTISGINYKYFTTSELKNIDESKYDKIEQIYLNLYLCRIAGQVNERKDEVKQNITSESHVSTKSQEIKKGKEVAQEYVTQHARDEKNNNFDNRLSEFKESFLKEFNRDYGKVDWDANLLIDKISNSIKNHSSSDLKKYLRDYTSIPMLRNIKSEYDRAMSSSSCALLILKILDGLRNVFEDDDIALHHIDKCYLSIEQLQKDKSSLAKKLQVTEEKNKKDQDDKNQWSDEELEDEDDFTSDDDDDECEYDFAPDDDEEIDSQANIENQLIEMKHALVDYFNNDTYRNFNIERTIDLLTNSLITGDITSIEEVLEDLLLKAVPGKDIDSIQNAHENCLLFNVIYVTCTNIGKILNNRIVNSFITGPLEENYKLFNMKAQLVSSAYEDYSKKQKTKQNWKKAGSILGTIALSPLIALSKAAEWSEEYSQKPEVQERRRSESIRYYCKFCGEEFTNPRSINSTSCTNRIRYDQAKARLEGRTPSSFHYHMIYEGGQKSEYECKYCHKKYKSIWSMVNGDCCIPKVQANRDKYVGRNVNGGTPADVLLISHCEPAL